ncbi:MAG: hypothetical protein FWD91_03735 [Treponema sp.]|nr:hypothetical protein [Treponema sp.]
MKRLLFSATLTAIFVFSCGTMQPADEAHRATILPLTNGWYQYDFTRRLKGIEDEYNFFAMSGMPMVQELTWKYTGVVARVDNGALFDPVTGVELQINDAGEISSAQNISIRGTVSNDGTFQWSGLHEEHGRLNSVFVKGKLAPLPASARGGRQFDGVFHLTDSGTSRQQLVKISNGFYTWSFLDDEETGFTPWPTLIHPDGTFSFGMDMTTVMEMGGFSSQNFSTSVSIEGTVIPGLGITMEEITRTAGLGVDQAAGPQIFSGTTIRAGEFPNANIPDTADDIISAGRAAVRALPRPNSADFPPWYLRLPRRAGFMFATGEKTFAVQEVAFTMAEAAAAANLADQVMVHIAATTTEITTNVGTIIDERIRTEALQRLNYRIVEHVYNPKTQTAFVLLEMRLD